MNIGLIIIGDEILSGKRQDKHFGKVVELLGARGLQLAWARYLGDDRERLVATLRESFASGDSVFSCGGIGATPDDHTRQAAAAVRMASRNWPRCGESRHHGVSSNGRPTTSSRARPILARA